jgi:hypothetical protein
MRVGHPLRVAIVQEYLPLVQFFGAAKPVFLPKFDFLQEMRMGDY